MNTMLKTLTTAAVAIPLALGVGTQKAEADVIRIALTETPSDELAAFFVALDRAKAKGLDYSKILYRPHVDEKVGTYCNQLQDHLLDRALDNTTLLKKYAPQCQFGMWVSGWTSWTLAAYCPDMPGVIVDVKPSPEWHKAFDKVVPAFIKQVDEGVRKIQGLRFGEDELGRMAAEVFG